MMKRMVMALCASAAVCLAGCVPGEAEIKVKSSELAKMAKGEIGWADVTIIASNAYPNVTIDVFPERARNLKPPMTYAQPGYGEFSVTNRLSDAMAFMVKELNGALPDFFCRDEKVALSCSSEGTNAVLVLRAELKVPIGKKAVLENADLPRVLQFAIEDDDDKIVSPDVAAVRRYSAFLNVTQTALRMAGYAIPGEANKDDKDNTPIDFETLLGALTNVEYLDKIKVSHKLDVAAAPTLKSCNAEKAGSPSSLWIEGEGFMSKWEREMREKMVPTNAMDVVFNGDEHNGRSVSHMYARTRCKVDEASFLEFARERGYKLAVNSMENVDPQGRVENPRPSIMGLVVGEIPANYLSYACIYTSNGGLALVYDRDRQILHGWYSHH